MQNKKGFTLLELLVVVLIIGILVAIALPQYQMAVGKAKFATLKDNTRAIKSALDRYYLAHDSYTRDLTALDIELKGSLTQNNGRIDLTDGSSCFLEDYSTFCRRKIFGISMEYDIVNLTSVTACTASSVNVNDKANRLCQMETGKSTGRESGNWMIYYY